MARDERRDDGPGDGQVRPAPAPAPDPAAHPTRRFTDASPRPAADLLSPRRRHSRAKKKREAREAHERRVARETLEARIRVVLAASPEDRTPEQTALLDAHPSVVAPMRATLERALLRKSQTEARLEEREDPSEVIAERVARLADMIRHLGSFVLHTGAGFSTAARIPDFRGASGVWTMRAKGMSVAMPKFEDCAPTRAHMCAVALHRAGYLTRVVTQNVDGLHTRAGLPPRRSRNSTDPSTARRASTPSATRGRTSARSTSPRRNHITDATGIRPVARVTRAVGTSATSSCSSANAWTTTCSPPPSPTPPPRRSRSSSDRR